jgi:small subunit ribosomal protein S17
VVKVENFVMHPLYHRFVRTTSKFMAHDEDNTCNAGDRVLIEECRPVSRRKRWRVRKVLERAE